MGEQKTAFETALASGKSFSDYLAFHVRFLFCVLAAFVAVARPAFNFIYDPAYRLSAYLPDIAIMLFFLGHALAMGWYIFRVGKEYIFAMAGTRFSQKIRSILWLPVLTFFALEFVALGALAYQGGQQTLRLFNIDFADFVCATNDRLSGTNYPLTPDRPDHCQGKRVKLQTPRTRTVAH